MNRQEFIDQLRQSLNGRLDAEQVSDNVRYYEEYIDSQIRQGKDEGEVMMTLGSPRLIARSITDAWMREAPEEPVSYRETVRDGQERRADRDEAGQEWEAWRGWTGNPNWNCGQGQGKMPWLLKFFRLPRWLRYVAGFAVLFLVLVIVLSVLQFFLPVIALFLVAAFFVRLFNRLN